MIGNLKVNEEKLRDLYLRSLALGEIQGPPTGYPTVDKPWLKYYDAEAILYTLPPMTVYEYLLQRNQHHIDQIALNYFHRKITFGELFQNINNVTKAFLEQGIQRGDIVTISMPNTPEAVYMFYALSRIGAIANMVDPRTSAEGIAEYLKEAESKMAVVIDVAYEKIDKIADETKLEKIISVSPSHSLPLPLKMAYRLKDKIEKSKNKPHYQHTPMSWEEFYEIGKKSVRLVKPYRINRTVFEPNQPLVIVHTGGTTGIPKGVQLSNENINAVAYQSVLTGIDMQRQHNWLDIMPPFIAYGVGMGLHLPLTIGMETILIPQFDPKKFDLLIDKYRPIHMVGVPSYWGTIIKSKKLKNQDLSYMIAPTVGGDAMDIQLEQDANEFLRQHKCNYPITKGYGMTEVCGGVAGTVVANNEIGSVGIPFTETTIGIFDETTGKELPYYQPGEVCITGPNVMLGYFKNEEATKDIMRTHEDGKVWIHSGDIGYMTENGNLFIVDRIKRLIIRYDGFKIFPSLIEKVIMESGLVKACKVVGMPDIEHSQGKLPCAYIQVPEQTSLSNREIEDQLRVLCDCKLPEYAQPKRFQFISEFSLTPVGKIDTLKLENEIREEVQREQKTYRKV